MRLTASALLMAAIASFSSPARGQSAMASLQDDDPPLDEPLLEGAALQPPAPPFCVCGCHLVPAPGDATERELTSVIVAGATAATISYLFATVYVATQADGLHFADSIPFFGAFVAAQRHPIDQRTAPLLLFSAGVQAIGTLAAAMAGAELAARHRLLLDLAASSSGASVSLTLRY